MNKNVEELYFIGKKNSRLVIGLMSGTSLDGLDVVLCEISDNGLSTKLSILQFATINFDNDYKQEIRTIFSKRDVDLQKLCLLNEWIGKKHADIVNSCLAEWDIAFTNVDLIASHGQTVYHAPAYLHKDKKFGNGTLQIGDGDHIALNTGIITISDFRQKHIAAGGEGAPLACYGEYILFAEKESDVILVNIGGISNFTYIPANSSFNKIICSDIGPGNSLMDAWIQNNYAGEYYDKDANIARQGKVNAILLNQLKMCEFFSLSFPKSTGPELFNLLYIENAILRASISTVSSEDVMTTLNQFTATIIIDAIIKVVKDIRKCKIYISGGGLHNPLLMDYIQQGIPGVMIHSTMEKNINPDGKEAVIFALLANECVSGNGADFGKGTNSLPSITMGKISFPT